MHGARPTRTAILAAALACVLVVPPSVVAAARQDVDDAAVPVRDAVAGRGTSRDLDHYLLFLGDQAGRPWGDGRMGVAPDPDGPAPAGTWSVTPSPIRDGRLRLHVEVEPPGWALPVEPGPAVLVVSLALGGGFEGDMYRRHPVSVDPVPLPPCGDPCRFVADVSVDVHRLPRLAQRIDDFQGTSAEVNLALVRSFAGGTWLQVVDGSGEGEAGTLGTPVAWVGTAPAVGLFPASTARGRDPAPGRQAFDDVAAVATARHEFADPTAPPGSREVRFRATVDGCDEVDVIPSLGTRDGDRASFAPSQAGEVDATVSLPVGTTWRVELDAAATPVVVGDHDLSVRASYACDEDDDGALVVGVSADAEPEGPETAAPEPPAATPVARPDVRDVLVPTWDGVAIDGQPIVIPGDEIATHADRHPTMWFWRHGNDTWAVGGGACNGWGAVVDVGVEGSFVMDDEGPWSTLVGCGEPRESIDEAFADALGRARRWEVAEGMLRLIDGDGTEVLAFVEAPAPSLPGHYYLTSVHDREEAELRFEPAEMPIRVVVTDDTISTTVGCNEVVAGYRQDGHRLQVVDEGPPVTWCDGLMDLESGVRAALLSASSVHADGSGALTLLDTYGFPRAWLARTDDPEIFGHSEPGDDALPGTSWTVRMLRDPATLDDDSLPGRRDLDGDDVTVSFGAGSQVTASTPCGAIVGTYRTERSWIAIDAHTLQPCEDPARAWTEAILLDALNTAGTFQLDDWLVLRAWPRDGTLLLAEPRD